MKYFNEEDKKEFQELSERITKDGQKFLRLAQSMVENMDIPDRLFSKNNLSELYELLRENSVYRVEIKVSANNIKHEAILLTGFKNGNYWTIVNNSYDETVAYKSIYSIRIKEYLCTLGRQYLQKTDE